MWRCVDLFVEGDIIDGQYRVKGVCSHSGGMGVILFVNPLNANLPFDVVLKYCRENDPEQLNRFRREVRLLMSYQGNSKVVQIAAHNLDHDPPYFVMKYYRDGDLTKRAKTLQQSHEIQEQVFLQMIDCLQELHSRNEYHRDIKPQNFLFDNDQVVVSDFGLAKEVGSNTEFTSTTKYWGTYGYLPPEFLSGGFKYADATGDIFMLGKTMYVLLTGRGPAYLLGDDIPAPIFHIIERCCSVSKGNRYQTLSELKQSLVAAYDVLLGRADVVGKVRQLMSAIRDRLEQQGQYDTQEVTALIEQLALCDEIDQKKACFELSRPFFVIMSQNPLTERLAAFLLIYERMVESGDYSWHHAETIASNMRMVFDSPDVTYDLKAKALQLAIQAADLMNRFAAMDTCRAMITSVRDEALGLTIAPILMDSGATFITGIEPSACQSEAIRNALRRLRE